MARVDVQMRRSLTVLLGALCLITFVCSIVSLSVTSWVKTTASGSSAVYTGLFLTDETHAFDCNGSMSVAECGYLKASKASGIISGIFGLFALLVFGRYVKAEGYLTSMGAFIAASCGYLQTAFAVICVVYYSFLKRSYFTYNDDLNVEYATNEETTYQWAFFLMCCATFTSFVYSTGLVTWFVYLQNDHGYRSSVEYSHLSQR